MAPVDIYKQSFVFQTSGSHCFAARADKAKKICNGLEFQLRLDVSINSGSLSPGSRVSIANL